MNALISIDYDTESSPEEILWRSVLLRAIRVACQRKQTTYFLKGGGSFKDVCEILDMDWRQTAKRIDLIINDRKLRKAFLSKY